ncbi:MAG: ISAs1 family transposase [Gammaproteobacteria bacterium]|nr:ISAs1 family transposase [Gammaproteobacteria bacterium]
MEFLHLLSHVPDPRRAQGKKWQLGPVLLATILAVLSGATSYRKVHGFVEVHRERLNEAFGFGWKSVPAYSAIRTILRGIDGADLERIFRAHAAGLAGGSIEGEPDEDIETAAVVAIDGKTLRHSFDAFNDRKAAHVLSAFAVDDMLILGHLQVDEKSNEIPAAQQMMEALALEGRLFTLDAMHCQKNIQGGAKGKMPSACAG